MWAWILAKLAPYIWRIVIVLVAIVTVIIAITWFGLHEYNKGWKGALNAVHQKDIQATGRASAGVKAVKDCDDAGGTWDVTSGVCQ